MDRPDPLAPPEGYVRAVRPPRGAQAPVHEHSKTCVLASGSDGGPCGKPAETHMQVADLQEHFYEADYCWYHTQVAMLVGSTCTICAGHKDTDPKMRIVRSFSLRAGTVGDDSVQPALDRIFGDDHD